MLGDAVEYVVTADPETLRFNDELLDLGAEKLSALLARGVRQRGDNIPDARACLKEPITDKLRDDLMRGIGIDLQLATEGPHRGKRVAR